MKGYVYCYTNKINGKKYVGQTINEIAARARKNGSGYGKQFKFGKAIAKYGWNNFEVEVLEIVFAENQKDLQERLNILERKYIAEFDSYYNGYNADLGGSCKIVSEETKQKLREKNLGKKHPEETKEKISNALKGVPRKNTDNYKKAGERRRGIPLSEDVKRKISETKQINHSSPEYISPNKGVMFSEERKRHISESCKGRTPWNKGRREERLKMTDNLLKKLKEMCDSIQSNPSRNAKINLLKIYLEDEDFLRLIEFLYNPYKKTGIREKKLEKDIPESAKKSTSNLEFFDLLDFLTNNNKGSSKETWMVRCFISQHENYKDFISKIITKNLILGIDATTVNKVKPNAIKEFNVQLANRYFDKPEIVEGKSFALTTKIDGGRIIALKENGEVSFWTRAGQRYEGLVDLEQEMKEKLPDNICLDGEITLLDPQGLTSKDQYKATMKITRKLEEKHGVKMLVFDCMTAEEFRNQYCPDKYSIRRENLISIFSRFYYVECAEEGNRFAKQTLKNYPSYLTDTEQREKYSAEFKNNLLNFLNTKYNYFKMLPILYQGNDTSKIIEWLNYNVDHGEEGIMINLLDGLYEFKRTSNLLKVKKFDSCDLKVVGFEEGSNRHQGRLGALLVNYKDNIVKVGSGFSDELRDEIWHNRDEWLGRTVVVQYFEETRNANGGISLRFPIYIDYRMDKFCD